VPKKFTVNCDFGGQIAPFTIVIGEPESKHHPLHFQADWLGKNRGGNISGEVMDAIGKLHDLAKKNNVSLEDLCVYALGNEGDDDAKAAAKAGDEQLEHQELPSDEEQGDEILEADLDNMLEELMKDADDDAENDNDEDEDEEDDAGDDEGQDDEDEEEDEDNDDDRLEQELDNMLIELMNDTSSDVADDSDKNKAGNKKSKDSFDI